jgi:cyclopropane fatty-acyl-phospholipid synthase-like methyltransferase
MHILEEIGQYLPQNGRILDIGCGFGLFTLYYALLSPGRRFVSIDVSRSRIDTARSASRQLDLLERVSFENRSAESLTTQALPCDAAYMLDLMHHLPRAWHRPLLDSIFQHLASDGILIVKDIATVPRWKMAFTWILDMLMSPQQPPGYIDTKSMRELLESVGFDVKIHALLDILPYPHVLYVCRKSSGTK